MDEVKVAICDDEEIWRRKLVQLCNEYSKKHSIEIVVNEFESGTKMIAEYKSIPDVDKFDILFLDIEMPGMNGIEVKETLWKERNDIKMFFVTSHEENVYDSFGKNVYGFIQKPIKPDEFERKMKLILRDVLDDATVVVKQNSKQELELKIKEIIYIRTDGRYSKIYTNHSRGYIFSDRNVKYWHNTLRDMGFAMSTNGTLINIAHVNSFDDKIVYMSDGTDIRISKRRKNKLNDLYEKIIWSRGY